MFGLPKALEDMLPSAIDSYKEQFRDLSENWRHLDTKAQGAGAISGVFLAAALAWVKDIPSTFTTSQRVILTVSVAFLILAVGCAVRALQIRKVFAPPLGSTTANMIKGMIEQQDAREIEPRLMAFYNDQMGVWEMGNSAMETHLEAKGDWIKRAHWLLLASAVSVAAVVITKLF